MRQLTSFITTNRQKQSSYMSQLNLFVDGLVPGAVGQQSTVVQYAIKGTQVYCAKTGPSRIIEKEFNISQRIHSKYSFCPTVYRLEHMIDLPEEKKTIIGPFYPITLQHLQCNALLGKKTFFANVALCGIASIQAFASANMSHGDIKPSNIMLDSASNKTVLIDFGTAEDIGSYHSESSPYYSLDCDRYASTERDLICLATSILQLGGVDIGRLKDVYHTCEKCRQSDHISHKLALKIFENRERPLQELMSDVYQLALQELNNDTADLLQPSDVNPILK
jgi:serine/threonine protein kinase